MTAYVIAEVNITNDSWAREYAEKLRPILTRHGGKFLARGKPAGKLEGTRPLPHVLVVIEFPSLEKATAWHADTDYKPLIKLRSTGSTTEIALIEGL